MTYRSAANTEPALERPPQLLGFAMYVLGTGCVSMGIAQLGQFVAAHSAFPSLPAAAVVGEMMALAGLAIAWRTTTSGFRRVLLAGAALWLTLLIIDYQSGQLHRYLTMNASAARLAPFAAPLAGRAIVLGLVAIFVHRSGRRFAAMTWPTTVGAVLVAADAWARTWPIIVNLGVLRRSALVGFAPPSMMLGVIGFLAMGGGLFAAGRSVLRGITVEEYLRAQPKRGDELTKEEIARRDEGIPGTRRGLPLFAEATVSVAVLAFGLAAAVASASSSRFYSRDVSESATAGGEIVTLVLLVVALRRMRPFTARALLFASAALAGVVVQVGLVVATATTGGHRGVYDVVTFVAVAPPLFAAACLHASSTAVVSRGTSLDALSNLRRHLRVASYELAGAAAATFLAAHTADPGARSFLEIAAVVVAAFAVYTTIRAAREARRIEVDLAA
ncbi:MAG: hypothetical protein JWP87_2036 [Labilithrix sp.]|nr:hypothetical protein [Labilithrix sp.]